MRRLALLTVAALLILLPGMSEAREGIGYIPGQKMVEGTKTLTAGAATPLFDLSVPVLGATGALALVTTTCSDGTDYVVTNYLLTLLCSNKAGTEACVVTGGTHSQSAASSGGTLSTATLGLDYTGTNTATLTFLAVCSLVETTLKTDYVVITAPNRTVTPR